MKNKILILLPDGVGIRNYLYAAALGQLSGADVEFWSALPDSAFAEVKQLHGIDYKVHQINMKPENSLSRLLRESATYARLVHNAKMDNNPTIRGNWSKDNKSFKLSMLYAVAEKIGKWAAQRYDRILMLERKSRSYSTRPIIDQYKLDLQKLQPSRIFITHQRVPGLIPICIAAKELGIEVITAVYSWDNLPKARMAVWADKYMVWSEHMKQEMRHYYPEVDANNVITTGTPQFEFYSDPKNILARDVFFERFGLDKNKKIICFSGDDVRTSPDDPKYLDDLAAAIIASGMDGQWQVLLRRCPVDFSGRFAPVVAKYSHLIKVADPLWHDSKKGFGAVFPSWADVALLASTAFYADVVINVGSTMAFDFAMFNKPAIFINYDQSDKTSAGWSVQKIYQFQHFRSMLDKNAVLWLNTKEAIVPTIRKAIGTKDNPAMDAWKLKVLGDYKNASVKISSLLEKN